MLVSRVDARQYAVKLVGDAALFVDRWDRGFYIVYVVPGKSWYGCGFVESVQIQVF